MNSANDKFSTEAKVDFKELHKRIGISKSKVLNSFKLTAKANCSTLESIESLYSGYHSSLEENYSKGKRMVIDTANSNYEAKENWFSQTEFFSQRLSNLESSASSIEDLPKDQYEELLATFKELTNLAPFTELCLKNSKTEPLSNPFDLKKSEISKRQHFKWFFINPADSSERPFVESVERQLENGFIRESCRYQLRLESGEVIGYAYLNAMEMETLNPRRILKLKRKAV